MPRNLRLATWKRHYKQKERNAWFITISWQKEECRNTKVHSRLDQQSPSEIWYFPLLNTHRSTIVDHQVRQKFSADPILNYCWIRLPKFFWDACLWWMTWGWKIKIESQKKKKNNINWNETSAVAAATARVIWAKNWTCKFKTFCKNFSQQFLFTAVENLIYALHRWVQSNLIPL